MEAKNDYVFLFGYFNFFFLIKYLEAAHKGPKHLKVERVLRAR